MNEDILEGNWKVLKGEILKQWGKLTNDEVDEINGDSTRLCGLIQERYGQSREQAEREVQDWQKGVRGL